MYLPFYEFLLDKESRHTIHNQTMSFTIFLRSSWKIKLECKIKSTSSILSLPFPMILHDRPVPLAPCSTDGLYESGRVSQDPVWASCHPVTRSTDGLLGWGSLDPTWMSHPSCLLFDERTLRVRSRLPRSYMNVPSLLSPVRRTDP